MKLMKVVRCLETSVITEADTSSDCKEINVETFDTIMFDLQDFDYNVNITEIKL